MSVAIKLEMPEGLYDRLKEQAGELGQSPEALALRCLEIQVRRYQEDPIEQFIGAFDTGIADLGVNHDRYIGQELLDKLRGLRDAKES